MPQAVSLDAAPRGRGLLRLFAARARAAEPTLAEALWAVASGLLLVLAFPDFGAWPLAWVGLAPLLWVVARQPRAPKAFVLGWLAGTLFFYASCVWLTYPMIHFAGIPAWVAYPLFLPAPLIAGLFPAFFALALARACARWGPRALFLAPPLWAALEWARYGMVGQLWNALGYSQAEAPRLVQAARFGGVYAVGFLLLLTNAALAYALVKRTARAALVSLAAVVFAGLVVFAFDYTAAGTETNAPEAVVVAVQPNVMPDFDRPASEHFALKERHFELSGEALRGLDEGRAGFDPKLPRVVVWPESPMNFSFASDAGFREEVARFVGGHGTSLIFNSLEPAPGGGGYNAAVLVNEEGGLAVQYDKIRLLPFGEYVPLPSWVPGSNFVRGLVGDFTPGARYVLMPLGGADGPRAGVFICIESAYPYITRRFVGEGADVLIEITNDAYQGDTAVLRQHLANAVFRAVETGRPVLRVTNAGITARVSPRGEVSDATAKFQTDVRVWGVSRSNAGETFYVKYGDAFALACSLLSLAVVALTFRGRGRAVESAT